LGCQNPQRTDAEVNLTHDDVQEILRLLDASAFDELRLETERFRLILRRGGGDGSWTQETETRQAPQISRDAAAPSPASTNAAPAAVIPGSREIRPPIIGTFYRAPQPGAPPFVEVGSIVHEDTVVAIIETMKLMNSIPAGVSGRIIEICVADAEFVDQDRVLMRVVPDKP
jgi:acetyl-CoA carboxylase biotin carboxyl carrier protein